MNELSGSVLPHPRNYFCQPVWGIPRNGDFQVSGNIVLQRELPAADELFTLAISSIRDYGIEGAFFPRVVPHLRLVNIADSMKQR